MPCSWSCRVILKVFGCCFQSVASAAQWSSFSRCQSGPFFLLCRAANYPRVAELFSYFLVTKERERLLLLLSLPGIFWKKQYCLLVFWKKEFWTLEKPLNSKHLMVGGFCRKSTKLPNTRDLKCCHEHVLCECLSVTRSVAAVDPFAWLTFLRRSVRLFSTWLGALSANTVAGHPCWSCPQKNPFQFYVAGTQARQ